ncbi:hypothetical protein C8R44DRAFT_724162 [Mycena epipterygia]|nr:hypothetical protein C8R44DRAFT_724162 [Mycena epipterygia]
MPNERERAIIDAIIEIIKDPKYRILLPWLLATTWEAMVSPVDEIREELRVIGRVSLQYELLMLFLRTHTGGMLPGFYGMLENCLLCEEVIFEMLSKSSAADVEAIAKEGTAVNGPFKIFVGGLWRDTQSLAKVTPFVEAVFGPLLGPAMHAYNEFRPPKKAKVARVSHSGINFAGELRILEHIYKHQLDRKPTKIKRSEKEQQAFQYLELMAKLPATPKPTSPGSAASSIWSPPANEGEEEEDDDESTPHLAPTFLSNTLWSPVPATQEPRVLLEPFSLKRKGHSSDGIHSPDRYHLPDNLPLIPPRSPLFPKDLNGGMYLGPLGYSLPPTVFYVLPWLDLARA